jgi:ComF family protein
MNTALLQPVRNWLNTGLGFLYPECCQLCERARATAAEGFVCAACRAQVKQVEPPFCHRCGLPYDGDLTTEFECSNCRDVDLHFSTARAAVVYDGLVREVIHRYKYRRALWFEPFLAGLLVRAAVPALQGQRPSCVVPVPLHPVKEREREFNQAARLAARLAGALQVPLNTNLLRRVSFTVTQTTLTRVQRAANMHGAFALQPGARVKGLTIVLVDDVLTTGATTSACARILRTAGAAEVCVWTAARGL